jgi:alpha-glucosidase
MDSKTARNLLCFLGGFLGWFLVNTLLLKILKVSIPDKHILDQPLLTIWVMILGVNIAVLITLMIIKKTRWISSGMLTAMLANLIFTLVFFSPAKARWLIPVMHLVTNDKIIATIKPTPSAGVTYQIIGAHMGGDGRVNSANCQAFGWVTVPGQQEIDLTIRILADGQEIAQAVANQFQEDLQGTEECPDGNCKFTVDLWELIPPDSAHEILVQVQDPQTGSWLDVSNSPQKIACLRTDAYSEVVTQKPALPTYTLEPTTGSTPEPGIVSGQNRVKFQSGNKYLIVEFLSDDLVHFEISIYGSGRPIEQPVYTSPMIAKKDYPGPSSLEHDGERVLETPDLRIEVDQQNLCISATDKTKDPDLVLTTICPLNLDQSWKGITLTPESFTHVYGLGQQFLQPGNSEGDWVGRVRSSGGEMGNAMASWNGGAVGNTQFPIAYFTGRGTDSYALFMDNIYKQNWDFTTAPWKAEMWGNWLRFYIMTGPDLQDLRQDYMDLVGHPLVPPKKMFGLWISEYGYDNWSEMKDKLRTLHQKKFPVDGFVLDLQWFGGIQSGSDNSSMGSLTWDTANFPSPATEISRLREDEGIGIMVIEESYISKNLDEHADLESRDYLARECQACGAVYLTNNPWWGKGGMIDWSNPSAGEYWHDTKREPLIEDGVIAHWTDLGEPEMYDPRGWYWGIEGDYLPLHEHWDIHNLYNFFWSRSIYEGYLRNGHTNRPFILSRSGSPGSQRYGVSMWSGDIGSNLSSLATHMNAQLHMSMSGIDYYGSDIGGFHRGALDGNLNEMYTQWFANGMAFDIPGRAHTENLCNCKETAPDRIGDLKSNLANLRQRYEFSPYYYSLSHRAYLFGEPLLPPLVYYFQDDPEVREMGHEKMIGRDLLAAIVAAYGEKERQVYLPAGDWINYHTNQWFHSSGEWFGPFPTQINGIFRLPLFARAGAILPQMFVDEKTMNILGKRIDVTLRNELIIQVYADEAASSFTLYEDDGETIAYQNGEVRSTLLTQEEDEARIIVTIEEAIGTYPGAPDERANVVKLIAEETELDGLYSQVTRVLLNGKELPQFNTQAEFDASPSGWYHAGNYLILAKSESMPVTEKKTFEFLKTTP